MGMPDEQAASARGVVAGDRHEARDGQLSSGSPHPLAGVLDAIEEAGINVEYMYTFAEKVGDRAALILRVKDTDAALATLAQSPVTVLGEVGLYAR